jgi:uracil-DNA glycosylase
LVSWARQGVLLLNASLTVEADFANSHRNKGWELLTDKIIYILDKKDTPVVFLLWGNNAKQKIQLITNKNHLVLNAVHPSPLSANRGVFGWQAFFLKTNQFLKKTNQSEIDCR